MVVAKLQAAKRHPCGALMSIRPGLVLWWSRNWITVVTGLAVVGCLVAATTYGYLKGAAAAKPKLAVAEGQAAVATTNDANTKDALTATSERRKVEVTIKKIERETSNVVAEAYVKDDVGGALDGWATGIARLRALDETHPNAGPDERP